MQDLSSLTNWATGLNAGESMSGGNTVSYDDKNTAMKGPGSEPVFPRPEVTDTPSLDVSGPPAKPTTIVKPGNSIPSSGEWKKAGE